MSKDINNVFSVITDSMEQVRLSMIDSIIEHCNNTTNYMIVRYLLYKLEVDLDKDKLKDLSIIDIFLFNELIKHYNSYDDCLELLEDFQKGIYFVDSSDYKNKTFMFPLFFMMIREEGLHTDLEADDDDIIAYVWERIESIADTYMDIIEAYKEEELILN